MTPLTEAQQAVAVAMTEKELLALVRDAARTFGYRMYHTLRSKGSEAGFPDLILLRDGVGWAIELKREGKEPTPAQHDWLYDFTAAGFRTAVWRPTDWLSGRILEELR